MWERVREKVERLAAIDRRCQAFGADAHRYSFRQRASEADLASAERRLGARLPQELRTFYLEVGDGGAGPHYGLHPSSKLSGRRANEPYPGLDALREAASRRGSPPDEEGYFEAPSEALVGLVAIADQGCGHSTCLVTSGGSAGRVVHVSCDGHVVETEHGLVELYEQWLDSTIERFKAVRDLMDAGRSYRELCDEMMARYELRDAGDLIASIADVDKPVSLFGTPSAPVYHGARQFPWYARVLASYQRARGRS